MSWVGLAIALLLKMSSRFRPELNAWYYHQYVPKAISNSADIAAKRNFAPKRAQCHPLPALAAAALCRRLPRGSRPGGSAGSAPPEARDRPLSSKVAGTSRGYRGVICGGPERLSFS